MSTLTKIKLKKFHNTVNVWLADYKTGKTHQPVIYPIQGEPPCYLEKCDISEEDGELEATLEYSSDDGDFGLTLSTSEWRGDEIMSIGSSSIRFAESGEPGIILVGQPIR